MKSFAVYTTFFKMGFPVQFCLQDLSWNTTFTGRLYEPPENYKKIKTTSKNILSIIDFFQKK